MLQESSTCIRAYRRACLMQLDGYHHQDARTTTDHSEEWHCPAVCQDIFEEQQEILRRTHREQNMVGQLGDNMGSSIDDQTQRQQLSRIPPKQKGSPLSQISML